MQANGVCSGPSRAPPHVLEVGQPDGSLNLVRVCQGRARRPFRAHPFAISAADPVGGFLVNDGVCQRRTLDSSASKQH